MISWNDLRTDPSSSGPPGFLTERPKLLREDPYLFVHGSARNPLNEYVFPDDVYNPSQDGHDLYPIPKYCFQGHNPCSGVFIQVDATNYQFRTPEELGYTYFPEANKIMCNVGSVGQPRIRIPGLVICSFG